MKKKFLAFALILATLTPLSAMAIKVQCGSTGGALVYWYGSSGEVIATRWYSQHPDCV